MERIDDALTREELSQTILTYNDYLDKMTGVIRHVCEDARESEFSAVQTVLPAVIDGMGWIYMATEGLVGMGQIEVAKLISFQAVIKQLSAAMEERDQFLMHSLFSHDLPSVLVDLRIGATPVV